VTELLLDESGPKRTITWFLPVVSDKVAGAPSSVEDLTSLLETGEHKRVIDAVMAKRIELIKTAEEHYVLGIVLEPEVVDAQKDIYSPEEVRQAAFRFMEQYRQMGLMHRAKVPDDRIAILESYISPTDFEMNGVHVKKGTWLLGIRVKDPELWAAIKSGDLTGYSIGGSAVRKPDTAVVQGG
jgi:hypothetical protein